MHHGDPGCAITIKGGRVEQTNFDTWEMLRTDEAPATEVHIVRNLEPPGGVGEVGTSCSASNPSLEKRGDLPAHDA